MRTRDVAGDGEAEARAAFVLIARLVETMEWAKHVLAMLGGDARPVVVDADRHEALFAGRPNDDRGRVTLGVGDEIADAALDRQRPHLDGEIALDLDLDARAVALGLGAQALENGA
jgi:hypothetical protein